ncbi:MAG TPA: type III-B CRISPR module RAMP protein Cmr4 [Polyangium sp.]|nr:type III-B CRISPR module RAMP protein Cmr4 [Polyangium sp.]
MKTRLYFIHALSPLHAGTGQSVGAIDLPIARERPTGIPLVPGSSIKGAMRALSREYHKDESGKTSTIFGPDTPNASEHAGAVQFSDARLLLLPVRSIAGTFAWVTSPFLLQRFARDAKEAGITITLSGRPAQNNDCFVVADAAIKTHVNNTPRVVLEDFDFTPSNNANHSQFVATLADILGPLLFSDADKEWRETLKKRLCIVHDDVMSLLLETATEVVARIRLDDNAKTVAQGALWYEEALPTESILYGLTAASDVSAKGIKEGSKRLAMTAEELLEAVAQIPNDKMVQLGGKATVGRGVCRVRMGGA